MAVRALAIDPCNIAKPLTIWADELVSAVLDLGHAQNQKS